jgi:LPXTG-site transpeptidase (sortase) family protein
MDTKNKVGLSHKIFCILMLLLLSFYALGSRNLSSAHALQAPSSSHTITYFQGNRPGAVSFTFDDGLLTQATTGVAELNARGLKGTFFVITSRGEVPWATWRTLAAQGHEIGSHTVSHQSLVGLTVAEITWELSESQSIINQNVYNQSCITIAYPLTDTNSTVQAISANYYVASRGGWMAGYPNYYQPGQDAYGSWNTVDFDNVGSMLGDYLDLSIDNSERGWFYRALDNAAQRHAWYDLHFHEINDGAILGAILDEVQGRDLYWMDTFGNIARYMRERLNSTVQVVAETGTEIRLQVIMDASLPTSLYNVPLTIRSTVPDSWVQVIVQQGSNIESFSPIIEGGEKVVYYNALPNGGDVVLLSVPYPVPGITSLDPDSTFAEGSTFTLTVNGDNFVTGSIVRWNNSNRATTYVSNTQLRATIPASDIASVGTADITVFNPWPGGGTSNQLLFTINPPPLPGEFTKSGPADGATNQSTGPTLSWEGSSAAISYEYCYDATDDNTCSNWTSNGPSTSVTLSGLAPATTYYWHVRAVNSVGTTYSNDSADAFWSFMVDNTPPVISSISRTGANPTNLSSVDFTVTFSESVTGISAANFALVTGGGITGASVASVSGNGAERTVTVITGSGDGTIGLNLTDGTNIADLVGNSLDLGNLPFTGEVYTIQKSGPSVTISAPSAAFTITGPVEFEVSIPGAATVNLQSTDVILNNTGTADATTIDVIDGDTENPIISISGITGDGTIGISLPVGIAYDILGNPSIEVDSSTTFVVDNTAPQIAVDGIGSNAGIIGYDFQVITKNLNQISIKFDEDAYDPPDDSEPEDVTNPANYLLVRDLGTTPDFRTVGCADPGAVEPDDTKITIDSPVLYDSENFMATFTVNGGSPLSNGYYRLYVCGSTSITDRAGMHLAGNGEPGTDFLRSFIMNAPDGGSIHGDSDNDQIKDKNLHPVSGLIPTTGFAPGQITKLPHHPADKTYTSSGEMQLEIPSLMVNVPIVGVQQDSSGWDLTWLGNNAGYLEGTAYPTWAGNTVLTGHVLDATNVPGPFANLKGLNDGDRIYIDANGSKYVYQVERNFVVSASNTAAVFEHEGYDWLTLVTCENYSNIFKRYLSRRVVKAVLVSIVSEK